MREDKTPFYKLENTIRNYAWGSYDGLSLNAGIAVEGGKPAAECWMGSHPDAPSSLVLPDGGRLSLQKFIRDYPMKSLGEEVFAEYGDLPFLFKALSASMPLSIQVHPDKAKAEAGYAREDERGIPRAAPERNYKDRNHKPELAVALSSFSALCGFRSAGRAAEFLGQELRGYFGFSSDDAEGSFRRLLARALTLRDKDKAALEAKASARSKELAKSADAEARIAGETTLMCYQHYPHDPGAISPLFMNVLLLEPGEGVYIPAGVMHAYLKGTILEIMATSDNVIRGGLTHKHIDVDDLLGILDFGASPLRVYPAPDPANPSNVEWVTPAREFALSRIDARAPETVAMRASGPEILLCTEGSFRARCTAPALARSGEPSGSKAVVHELTLARGESAFIGAACKTYELEGKGRLYRASAGGLK